MGETVRAARSAAVAIAVGDPLSASTRLGPSTNTAQYRRVRELIQAGIDEGATFVRGGTGVPDGLDHGFFVRLMIFSSVTPTMRTA